MTYEQPPLRSGAGGLSRPDADPIVDLLLRGEAQTVAQAEEMYLDSHLSDVIRLVESPISDEAFRRHPLIMLLLAHGSRGLEDSLW